MADQDILQAIRIIDDKIASLQDARDRLASAFGVTTPPVPDVTARTATVSPTQNLSPIVKLNAERQMAPRGRKEQLAEFLRTHGPMPRAEIIEKAGLPEGTVSYCLGDKRFFVQVDDGSWDITEFSRRGLERKDGKHNLPEEEHGDDM